MQAILDIVNTSRPIYINHISSKPFTFYAHYHASYEIYVTLSNNIKFFVNDRIYSLKKGDIVLFNSTDLHKVSVPSDINYERLVLTFLPELVEGVSRDLLACFDDRNHEYSHVLSLDSSQLNDFFKLTNRLEHELAQTDSLSSLASRLALYEILLYLNRIKHEPSSSAVHASSQDKKFPQKLSSAQLYIDNHYCENITLDLISSACYIDKSYLCRLFKKELGFTVNDYITYKRLSKAVSLLLQGESAHKAAYLSGFNSDTYFSTLFKKHMGIAPSHFCKSH